VLVEYDPIAIVAEAFAMVRDSSSAAKTAMTWGVLALACERAGLPLASLGSQAVKQALCGAKDASKADVAAAALARVSNPFEPTRLFFAETPESHREHAMDALATSLVALEQSEVIRAACVSAR